MAQYVVDIKHPRPTPISMEECAESGIELGRYDLCLAMAQSARRIQKQRTRSIARGYVSYGQPDGFVSPFSDDVCITAMKLAKESVEI